MCFLRKNWFALLLILGILASVAIVERDSVRREQELSHSAQNGCRRDGLDRALNAQFALGAARTRRVHGDKVAASYYEATGWGLVSSIAAPKGLKGNLRMATIEPVAIDGHVRMVLTAEAAALQREGCRQAYP